MEAMLKKQNLLFRFRFYNFKITFYSHIPNMKTTLTLSILLIGSMAAKAQSSKEIWSAIDEKSIAVTGTRDIIPAKYKTYHLDVTSLKGILGQAPSDKNVLIKNSPAIISLPMPNGQVQRFYLVEAPVMDPILQASYPDIRTYSVHGIDDAYASGKLDLTEFGFHGMIRSPNGDVYIDPYCKNNIEDYITYYTADFNKPEMYKLPEVGVIDERESQGSTKRVTAAALCLGANLKTYRLAIGCTGEYAVAATGLASPSVSQTLAKVVTTVNRVDGVYETEVAVRLVLVPTTTLTLYTVSGSGYTAAENSNANSLITKSQSLITSQIGTANFDIGHTFSTGGGGLANLGCVCSSGSKAKGITGSPSPVGDPYDIDYVAHEMGHQFGGDHTFNANAGAGSCAGNRNTATSMEPGSGVSIMAYAGICGTTNDLAPHSIAYFHAVSYDEISVFITSGGGNSCDVQTATSNNPPSVTVSPNLTTAPNTPFTLTGSATDPDGDALTYQWEEMDAGASPGANWNSGSKPFFRSYNPVTTPDRSFPSSAVIASGNLQATRGEYFPTTAQVLKFRLTARDNKMGGGGVCSATTQVTIVNFSVTSQNTTGISYPASSTQSITWAVNGTDLSPINCASVNIHVSTNSGTTYSLVLANTPNDGSQTITMPNATSSTCRVKVSSSTNVFFDANDFDFAISGGTGIKQYSSDNLNISYYPNPFSGIIKVQIAGNSKLSADNTLLKVYDVLGNVVKTEKLKITENYSESFDLSNLANGSYMVEVTDGQQRSVTRLVKL
jgi:hypothetical protein